jgi:hypothetical protein
MARELSDVVASIARSLGRLILFSIVVATPRPAGAQITRNTVGPTGSYANIQSAVDACPVAVECHVDVRAGGVYTENILFPSSYTSGTVRVTGGWDATYSTREEAFKLNTIDGGGTGRVLDIQVSGGTVEIEGFIVENGSISSRGAGIHVDPSGASAATVKLTNLQVRNSHASGHDSIGGGVNASLDGSERLEIDRCEINQNSVATTSGTNWAMAGGLMIASYGSASFLVEDSWIEDNTATSDTAQKKGAGHFFTLEDDSSGEIVNLHVSDNTAAGTLAAVTGAGGYIGLYDNSSVVVRRSVWVGNTNSTGSAGADQLNLSSNGSSTLLVTDSAVALGDQDGLDARARDTSTQRFVNLTIADNTLMGIVVQPSGGGTASLYNSISYGNGTDAYVDAGVATGNNLIGTDPLWVSPGAPHFNYHLDAGSPALDAGDNAPPGGLGTLDLDGRPRIENAIVDLGCFEGAGLIFWDDFEGGGTGEWSSEVP